jgi:four helix bundle protein
MLQFSRTATLKRVADCEDRMADKIKSYRDLDAWQVAMSLTELIYSAVKSLPPAERFELNPQMRRASVSVPSNIAEGQASGADGLYIRHLRIACGSLGELSTQVEIARRLSLLPQTQVGDLEERLTRTGQVLHGLLRSRLQKRRRVVGSGLLAGFAFWLLAVAGLG